MSSATPYKKKCMNSESIFSINHLIVDKTHHIIQNIIDPEITNRNIEIFSFIEFKFNY